MAGNHETMNVAGRFTYATQPAMAEFLEWHALSRLDANLRVSLLQPVLTCELVCSRALHSCDLSRLRSESIKSLAS